MRLRLFIAVLIAALACPTGALAQAVATPSLDYAVATPATAGPATAPPVPAPGAAHDVIGISLPQLNADYWITRQPDASKIVLDRAAIARQNARLQQVDPSINDIEALPATLTGAQVRGWIEQLSRAPTRTLFDERGAVVPQSTINALTASLALDAIAPSRPTRYALVTRRADLRTVPTPLRVFNARGNTDIDRFQESALFPGTPVAIVHESRDGRWWFVVSALYAAWVDKQHVALGSAAQVFGYGRKTPYLIVTGATAQTVFTPDRPGVSQVQLEMGVRVPLLADWPGNKPVNGQHPYTAHVIELPIRAKDGALAFSPALLPKLPISPAITCHSIVKTCCARASSSWANATAGATRTTRGTAAASCRKSTAASACNCRATPATRPSALRSTGLRWTTTTATPNASRYCARCRSAT